MGAVTVLDENRDQARRAARRAVALYLPVVADLDSTLELDPAFTQRIRAHVNCGDWDAAAAMISDEILDKFALSGNAEDVIEQAHRLFEAGAARVEFGTPHGLQPERGIQILGQHVLPALRALWSR